MATVNAFEKCLKELETTNANNCAGEARKAAFANLKKMVIVFGLPKDEKRQLQNASARQNCENRSRLIGASAEESNEVTKLNSLGHTGNTVSLRGRVWKALLGVGRIDAKRYINLVKMGEHPVYGRKILNDTFRTFQNNKRFAARVPEKKLIRILNAFVHAHANDENDSNSGNNQHFSYVQGMNAICGPLLYVLPELDAFYCFEVLMTKLLPSYVSKNLDGVFEGCRLLEICLGLFDPELLDHMQRSLSASSKVFAFAPVLTLSACSPPLDAVLELWDIYFAAGVHLNIIFFASQLILARDSILNATKAEIPSYLTGRKFPVLKPRLLAALCFPLLLKLPRDVYAKLETHTQY